MIDPTKLAKVAKAITDKGLPRPAGWPGNPYDIELEKLSKESKGGVSGFINAVKAGATGQPNNELSLWMNKKIVDLRDNKILEWMKTHRQELLEWLDKEDTGCGK